jgi:ABC-type phosphate transport system auxiliary subunit
MEPTEQTPPTDRTEQNSDDVARSLLEAEELLNEVKARYAQIQAAQEKQPELEARLSELKAEETRYAQGQLDPSQQPDREARLSEIKTELETVKTQLASTWEDLESQLITWRDKEELFWQFLRFAGIGFALALILNHFLK